MPSWQDEIRRRLAGRALERTDDIVEELTQHLDDHWVELVRRGVEPAEARRQTLAQLASEDALRRALEPVERSAPGERPLSGLGGDLRYAWRSLCGRPALSAVALLTLALGIGANVAIFSVVDAALLRPLPFRDPERLMLFWGTSPEKGLPVVNYPDALYAYHRERVRSLESLAIYTRAGFTLTAAGGDAERLDAGNVTPELFPMLGVAPLHGRLFLPEEAARGKNLVTLLGYGLWQRRFGGDPAIVGKPIDLNGIQTTVVGILPAGFDFPNRSQLWVPLGIDPQSLNCWCYWAIGRLAPGRTQDELGAEIDALNADFWAEREKRPPPARSQQQRRTTVVEPVARNLVGEAHAPMLVLLIAVGMVLLIACANVANLLLARAVARSREIAVRCCLGASPWRVLRQLLVESALLAAAGGAAGLLLGYWGVRWLEPAALERMPHLRGIALDPRALLFTLGVTSATAVLFGLVPALRAARIDLQDAIRDGARGSRNAGRRWNDAFVVAQFALSLMLLVGAGLLLRSFSKLAAQETGFRADGVWVGRLAPQRSAYREPADVRAFYARLTERLEALPGVRSVGLSSTAPFSAGNHQQGFVVQGKEPGPGQPSLVASVRSVTPPYFEALGTPLLRGRLFDERDVAGGELVAIVDESLARRHWPDGNAVGERVRTGVGSADDPWRTIVGVVASVRHQDLRRAHDHYVYTPFAQLTQWRMDLVLRTAGPPPPGLTSAVRAQLKAADPALPLFDVHTLEAAIADSLLLQRLVNGLLLAFALAALLLAAIGIYGVMALNVAERVNEFGIRLAIGATPGAVRALVLRRGLRLVLLGAALGLAGAAALSRFLGALLFQVPPLDPATFAAVTLFLLGVALLACWLPARRATAVDPLQALRAQ